MSRLWVNDGRVVIDLSGRLVLCDECPCETGTGTGTYGTIPFSCDGCAANVLAERWELTTGGVYTDFVCSQCENLRNRTFVVVHRPDLGFGNCYWRSDTFSLGPENTLGGSCAAAYWDFFWQPGIGWRLFLNGSIASQCAFDPIPAASFNCTGPNTFVPFGGVYAGAWGGSNWCNNKEDITLTPLP